MIEILISSKTRIKLLLKFFLNSSNSSYLRGLENEFSESSNAIRLELNRLEEAGMLSSFSNGNKKMYQANKSHPLFDEIHNILLKHIGLDKVINNVITRLGDVKKVYLSGSFAKGLNSSVIDLIFVGTPDAEYLIQLISKVEKLIKRKIRYLIYSKEEWDKGSLTERALLIWHSEGLQEAV